MFFNPYFIFFNNYNQYFSTLLTLIHIDVFQRMTIAVTFAKPHSSLYTFFKFYEKAPQMAGHSA